jgi:hypothetical protein
MKFDLHIDIHGSPNKHVESYGTLHAKLTVIKTNLSVYLDCLQLLPSKGGRFFFFDSCFVFILYLKALLGRGWMLRVAH